MAKKPQYTLKVIPIGNSLGIILPKKNYEFRDLEKGQWVKIQLKGVLR